MHSRSSCLLLCFWGSLACLGLEGGQRKLLKRRDHLSDIMTSTLIRQRVKTKVTWSEPSSHYKSKIWMFILSMNNYETHTFSHTHMQIHTQTSRHISTLTCCSSVLGDNPGSVCVCVCMNVYELHCFFTFSPALLCFFNSKSSFFPTCLTPRFLLVLVENSFALWEV